MAAERKRGFPPVVDARTRLLILGSLPGEASLAAGEYYGNPRNTFWRLLEQVLERPLVVLPYSDRLQALLERQVGLWDVIAEAERRGSLDAAILDPAANDLPALIDTLPQLETVAFNGATAARLGLRGLASVGRPLSTLALPSSSPAHAAVTFEQKAQAWAGLRKALA
ncbi:MULTISPECIES: DNA-deoxyinosine glycosylase [unclassified Caulobacter]|uniref:DNA-deoxyinosine glycosylase n=1 Tax=unclassified Caulobacter TaxID=2648921 RepID=UPI000D36C2B9|nr:MULTISPECIES: DNA-deoxyinosine glycosylase [unclassified Caulobacter]PTS87245.1 DNA-deoxyinosine glycosylase [Caulobacter sp. HMWF009]PTT12461.1 DNA-deoxyinosine glycosylase [Caulobacter sp. HMWF025]